MDVTGPLRAVSPMPSISTPTAADSLRQRQRDRLIPRGVPPRKILTTREAKEVPSSAVRLAPAPAPKTRGSKRASPVHISERRKIDESFLDDAPIPQTRAKGSKGEIRVDITPDGGSAGREGRQFTVANVGNNGKIYLR
jgi:hypothetical protein